jgi:hypothetical protein
VLSLLPFSPVAVTMMAEEALGASEEADDSVLPAAEGAGTEERVSAPVVELPQAQVPVMIIPMVMEKRALFSFTVSNGFLTMP